MDVGGVGGACRWLASAASRAPATAARGGHGVDAVTWVLVESAEYVVLTGAVGRCAAKVVELWARPPSGADPVTHAVRRPTVGGGFMNSLTVRQPSC